MKKLLKLCAAVLVAVTIFSLAGCSARTPITADSFKKQAEAAGFKVTDNSASNTKANKYLSATKADSDTELVFILFNTNFDASKTYSSIKTNISEGANGTPKNVDSVSYNKFSLLNGELSHTIVHMDATIVYGKTTIAHKDQVDNFLKSIKY